MEKGQSKSELRVPQAAGSHLVGTSCSAELSPLSSSKDGGRHRAFRKHLRSPGERGTGSQQQLRCQPRRRTPVTIYRGWWAGLHPSGSESTSPLSTPPKSKLAWPVNAAERALLGDRQGHPFPQAQRLSRHRAPGPGGRPSSSTSTTPHICSADTGAPEAKRTRRLLIWAWQLRLPRDPRFGSREGIKKKKGGGKDRKYAGNSHVCQRVLQSSQRRSRETAASFYILMFYTRQELPEEEC